MDKYRLVPNENRYMDFQYDSPFYDNAEDGVHLREANVVYPYGAQVGRQPQGLGLGFEHAGLLPPDMDLFNQDMQDMKKNLAYGGGQFSTPSMSEASNGRAKKPSVTTKKPKGARAAIPVEKKVKKAGGKSSSKQDAKKGRGSLKGGGADDGGQVDEHEVKRMKRLLRNRVSAQLARERKKKYVLGLEKKAKESDKKIKELQDAVRKLTDENASLKTKLLKSSGATQESNEEKPMATLS